MGFAGHGALAFGMVSNFIKKGFDISAFYVSANVIKNLSRIDSRSCALASKAAKDEYKFFIFVAIRVQTDIIIF